MPSASPLQVRRIPGAAPGAARKARPLRLSSNRQSWPEPTNRECRISDVGPRAHAHARAQRSRIRGRSRHVVRCGTRHATGDAINDGGLRTCVRTLSPYRVSDGSSRRAAPMAARRLASATPRRAGPRRDQRTCRSRCGRRSRTILATARMRTTISPACTSPSRPRATSNATTATANTTARTRAGPAWSAKSSRPNRPSRRRSPSPPRCRNCRWSASPDRATPWRTPSGRLPRSSWWPRRCPI